MNNGEKQKIYLIRHAKPDLPHGGSCITVPLIIFSEEGVMMAKRLAEALKCVEAETVFSSDLRRAMETAEIAFAGRTCEVRPVKELREIHLGDWEGRSFDEVRSTWNEIYEKRGAS